MGWGKFLERRLFLRRERRKLSCGEENGLDEVRYDLQPCSRADRLCEKPLKCHREDPRRVPTGLSTRRVVDESSTDEVGRRGDPENLKEKARLLRPDKEHRDSQ